MIDDTEPAVDLQPDDDEILQIEPGGDTASVPVHIIGPVRVQDLPRKAGATRTLAAVPAITNTQNATQILGQDRRRARATIMSIGQNMRFTFNMANIGSPDRMMLWPANLPYVHMGDTPVWVASDTATTSISWSTEMWAAGEA